MPLKDSIPRICNVALGLGSNLGDRRAHLQGALAALASLPLTSLKAVSAFIETDPVSPVAQGQFLNAAAVLDTGLTPSTLLHSLHAIESAHARNRANEQRWGPRTLDIDILIFGDLCMDSPDLVIPHPRMLSRQFVLEPLAQIAPDMPIPPTGITVAQSLSRLKSRSSPDSPA